MPPITRAAAKKAAEKAAAEAVKAEAAVKAAKEAAPPPAHTAAAKKNPNPKQSSSPKPTSPKQSSSPKPTSPKKSSSSKPTYPKQSSSPKPTSPKQSSSPKPTSPKPTSPKQSPHQLHSQQVSQTQAILIPKDLLNYRIKNYINVIDKIKEIKKQAKKGEENIEIYKYFLDINKLLASIEEKATGIVCLTNEKNINTDKNINFALKIAHNIQNDSVKEIKYLKLATRYVKEKGYYNLPIIYHDFQIKKDKLLQRGIIKGSGAIVNAIEKFISSSSKIINFNVYACELAKGDFKSFLELYDNDDKKNGDDLLLNATAQIMMSIATLHKIGILHNDTHHGNFLYHKINPGGYIKYTMTNNDEYYVKNCGYVWEIWDFGISELNKHDSMSISYFIDYEMLSLYLREDDNKYNLRYQAKDNNGVLVPRKNGNIIFEHKKYPIELKNITEKILRMSVPNNVNENIDNISIEELYNKLPHIINEDVYKQIQQTKNISPYNNLSRRKYVNKSYSENTFLIDNVIKQLPNTFLTSEKIGNINDSEILFHINFNDERIDDILYN
jgi:hypothetical protein